MKQILGLDLGTNSIGWALVKQNFITKEGNIDGLGSRIIPMTQDVLDKFGSGQSISQTAERTGYRNTRHLYERSHLRRERLHRILNVLGFLPEHYQKQIDFDKHLGQFKEEVKINYKPIDEGRFEFLFIDSFNEMINEFKTNGIYKNLPYDWTIYYLRKKALSQKIDKYELAWLLLNFNQKRGYYQLRGEEETEDDNKSFEVLKVERVEDSGERIKGKGDVLYDIYFENGWRYDKQTTKPEDWLHKTKEFIVTTKTLKDGSVKRTFKNVDLEKDWIAIKKKTEQDIYQSKKTVGAFIYDTLLTKPTQKIRGKLIKTIERKFYKDELRQILQTQIKYHPELQDRELYKACVEELYPKNKAHKNNIENEGFDYLFLDDIIFYQRPLKSKKSSIGTCQFEYRIFKRINNETGEIKKEKQFLKVIPKSHPLFIEFRLWQFLRNLKIYHKQDKINVDVTQECLQNDEEWCDLFDYLNDRKEVDQKNIIDYFVKLNRLDKRKKDEYRWNFQEDKKLPMNETRAQFLSRLKKVKNFDINDLNYDFLEHLWHIIYSVKDKRQYESALKTFAYKYNIDEESFVEHFIKHPPYSSDYGSYSQKAIKRLLPLMRVGRYWNREDIDTDAIERIERIVERIKHLQIEEGSISDNKLKEAIAKVADDEIPARFIKSFLMFKDKNPLAGLNTYQAGYAVYERHSELSDITQWKTAEDIDNYLANFKQYSLRNPIVEQLVMETLRTVRDIWLYYGDGKEGFFDEIHVELGRDMKNSADKRKSISDRNSERERTNERIKELLKELQEDYKEADIRPFSPSHQEILKIYEEGIYKNPSTKYDKVSEDDIQKIRRKNTPTKKDIEKYKLWLEQGYISPYTGQIIPLSKLFTSAYQIEHIIPQSRFFDDSMNNKVICESAVNEAKSNQTAYAFLKSRGGDVVDLGNGQSVPLLRIKDYEDHCSRYFKKNRQKLNYLLSEEVPEGFIERQMNDSRYIAKVVKSLLSNIVRLDNEQEPTSKKLLPTPGSVTSRLRHDWGLNDKWNEIIAPRFKRLNTLTKSQDFGFWDNEINAFRSMVPDELAKDFNKKRIDHRHHALDALVIACTTRDHTHYLHALNAEKENYSLRDKLLIKNKHNDYTKHFQLPWKSFTEDAKSALEQIVVSFKQNLRVINRTNNRYQRWVKQGDGSYKKKLVAQEGKNFAVRKSMHKETVAGKVQVKRIRKSVITLNNALEQWHLIVDKDVKQKVKKVMSVYGHDVKKVKKYLRNNPITIDGKEITKVKVYEIVEATATRIVLTDKFTEKQLQSVTDSGIRRILKNHVEKYKDDKGKTDYSMAFSPEGIEEMNKNIQSLNGGKPHQPIYKVRVYEEGSKFAVGETGNKVSKYVEADKGTNLFFAIYWDAEQQKRQYETVPLNEVIAHQKEQSKLKNAKKTPIPVKPEKGVFMFSLSPNDLVYVPTADEIDNPALVDFSHLTVEQVKRVYKFVSCTKSEGHFVPMTISKEIIKNENGTNSKNERVQEIHLSELDEKNKPKMIKSICWKLKTDRLGNIIKVIK
ncbi:MAG: CRISPR-associated protein Csn1 [Flavobacteriia bacterium]|nr:MAG: CRISPR-associated protein Csn1 [Flavobacteriia bacterium]